MMCTCECVATKHSAKQKKFVMVTVLSCVDDFHIGYLKCTLGNLGILVRVC